MRRGNVINDMPDRARRKTMDPFLYREIYVHGMLAITLISAFLYTRTYEQHGLVLGTNSFFMWSLPISLALFLGTRPISGVFVDMTTYAEAYALLENRGQESFVSDWAFSGLMGVMAGRFDVGTFFLVCSVLYIAPLAIVSFISHRAWAAPAFICMVGAFSFFTYGVNGIRQGIATSLAILAIALVRRWGWAALIMTLAVGMHQSTLAIAVAFLACVVMAWPAFYAGIWTICLLISAIWGDFSPKLVFGLLPMMENDRAENYLLGQGWDRGGFRLDFVAYSILPVLISYLAADKQLRAGLFYRRLLCTYLLVNSLWLLCMEAAFSNRFAYLSWCMLPWVVIYPLLPNTNDPESARITSPPRIGLLSAALIAHYSFTYFMFYVYYR